MTALIAMLACPLAHAEPLAPRLLPIGRKVDVDHEVYKCFVLEEWKLALALDDELWRARERIVLLEESLGLRDGAIAEMATIRASLEGDLHLAVGEVRTMTIKWESENRSRFLAEASRDWWRVVAAVVGGAAAISVTTAVIVR